MIPEPLHPAIVHFPIVLAILLPLVALFALWSGRAGADASRAWRPALLLAALLTVSSWAAVQTGKLQEDKVEDRVSQEAFEEHEEAGETFLILSGVLLVVMAGGALSGGVGRGARVLGTVGALALVLAAWQTGASGGELAYQHGAAALYAQPDAGVGATTGEAAGEAGGETGGETEEGQDEDDG
jgi:uncharacterized membrane protein